LKTNKNIKIIACLILVLALFIGTFSYLNIREVDTRKAKTEMRITTSNFLKELVDINDTTPYNEYIDKAIVVEGVLHKITSKKNTYTLLLKGNRLDAFVICEMREDQRKAIVLLKEGDVVKVKGILKGFLKDAILLNCIVIYDADE
jgi:hypothetical protein